MGNFPGSRSSEPGCQSGTMRKRLGKALKRVKKLGSRDGCTGQTDETATVETVQTDSGLAAWQALAGSIVLTMAVSVLNFTTHEAVPSLNEDFREFHNVTTVAPTPVTSFNCYGGVRENFERIIEIYLEFRNFIRFTCDQTRLDDEALYLCILSNYYRYDTELENVNGYCHNQTVENDHLYYYPCLYYMELVPRFEGASLFATLCSSLWPPAETFLNPIPVDDPLQPQALIAVENIFAASLKTVDDEKEFGDTLNYIFVSLGLSFVLAGAIISVYLGYRLVAILGSALVAIGFFIASFISTDSEAPVQLLVGGLAGIGTAFLRLAAVVALLEYFKELRMRILVMSGLGAVLINFLLIGITFVDGVEFYWRTVFRFQIIPAVFSLIISFIMKPVFLVAEAVEKPLDELQDRIEEQKDEVTCLTKLHEYVFSRELFTNNTFYLVLGVYFFDQIGRPIFSEGVQPMIIERRYEDIELKVKLQPLIENIGALIGLGCLLLIPSNKSKLASLKEPLHSTAILHDLAQNLTILAVLNIAIGLLCMHMPSVKSYPLTLIYSAVFGFTEGMFNSLMQDFIPDGFGRRHIRMMAGFLGLVAGVGSIIAGIVADKLNQNSSAPHSAFYFSGACLLISGGLSVATRFVVMRHADIKARIQNEVEEELKRREKEQQKEEKKKKVNTGEQTNQVVTSEDIEINMAVGNQGYVATDDNIATTRTQNGDTKSTEEATV